MINRHGFQLSRAQHVVAATFVLSVSLTACSGSDQDSDTTDDDSADVELAEQATPSYWTDWTTDGAMPVQCQADQVMGGFGARGKYADDIRMECSYSHLVSSGIANSWWSPWFSEEVGQNGADCGPGSFITGFACSGKYCDNVSIRCTQPLETLGEVDRCWRVGPFSEEKHWGEYILGGYPHAAYCTGKYCDNMEFDVCSYRFVDP